VAEALLGRSSSTYGSGIHSPEAAQPPRGTSALTCEWKFALSSSRGVYREILLVALIKQRYDVAMLSEYLGVVLRKARYEILAEDGSFYAEIPGFDGVYANAVTLEDCREELREVLEEWILFRVSRNLPLPTVEGRELTIRAIA